jgi:dTDP-4-dehydrorhamnose 3,5-epimerase
MARTVDDSSIGDIVHVRGTLHTDDRGWFSELYRAAEFARAGIDAAFVQDNASFSAKRGTLRGLHFQRPPYAQGKLVRCLRGSAYDVALDVRRGSPTEWKVAAFRLDADAGDTVWIPPGFAHGFQTLTDDCLIVYKTTAEYSAAHEVGIRWDDPRLAIEWPVRPPILSARDSALPLTDDVARYFDWSSS